MYTRLLLFLAAWQFCAFLSCSSCGAALPQIMRGACATAWKTLRPLPRLNDLAKGVYRKKEIYKLSPPKKRLKPVLGLGGLVIHKGSRSPACPAAPVCCPPHGPTRLPLKSARLRSHEQHRVKQAALMKHGNLERSCKRRRSQRERVPSQGRHLCKSTNFLQLQRPPSGTGAKTEPQHRRRTLPKIHCRSKASSRIRPRRISRFASSQKDESLFKRTSASSIKVTSKPTVPTEWYGFRHLLVFSWWIFANLLEGLSLVRLSQPRGCFQSDLQANLQAC